MRAWKFQPKAATRSVQLSLAATALTMTLCAAGGAQAADVDPQRILELAPEDLASLQVTSAAKKPQLLSETPASVYVITNEDIRRSAATNLYEALRLAPMLHVAQDNIIPNAVAVRGHTTAPYTGGNKMLVMIDGRSVYSQFFSGVLWDVQEVMLEDIDRIEIISGPAGVLWGTNAVNGVINIITRSAYASQGLLASATSGDRTRDGALRYGGKLDNGIHYRLYGKYAQRYASFSDLDRSRVDDSIHSTAVGLRADWRRTGDSLSFQMNALSGSEGQPAPGSINVFAAGPFPRIQLSSYNMLGRWVKDTGDGGSLAVQGYFDHAWRSLVPALQGNASDTIDVEIQRNAPPSGRHRLLWGASARLGREHAGNTAAFGFFPQTAMQRWLAVFAQDDISLTDRLRLVAGLRLERGAYYTVDALPSLRLAWQPAAEHLLWGGVSRGARSPSRFDTDFISVTGSFIGNRNLRSETVDTLEAGYRVQGRAGMFSINAFRSFYDALSVVTVTPDFSAFTVDNLGKGQSNGLGMWGEYRVTPAWKLSGGLQVVNEHYVHRPAVFVAGVEVIMGSSPGKMAQVRSSWDLGRHLELDVMARHVGALGSPVPAYNAIDARLGWKISKNFELALFGQNLLGTEHAELGAPSARALMAKRVFLKLIWRE